MAYRAADDIPDFDCVREVKLERAITLPSFIADEIARHYRGKKADPPQWKLVGTCFCAKLTGNPLLADWRMRDLWD